VFFARLLERFVHFALEGNPPGDFCLSDHDLPRGTGFPPFPVILVLFLILRNSIGIQPPFRAR